MLQRIKIKNKIIKILNANFEKNIPMIRVEKDKKNKKNLLIYYFRHSPKDPSPEEMKLYLEYGLNKNLRTIQKKTDISTSIFLLSNENAQINAISSNMTIEKTVINLDLRTKIDWTASPHWLINGATGTGKTYFLVYLLIELKKRNAELIVIDGKYSDLEIIGGLLNIKNKEIDNIEKINYVRTKMIERQNKVKETIEKEGLDTIGKDYRSYNMKPLFLVIDEYKSFIDSLDSKKEIETIIQDIVAKGRSLGIFVILASQRFSTQTLKNDIRSNFGGVFSLGNEKNETNLMLFNTTEVPIVGDYGAIMKSNEYLEIVDFEVPYIKDLKRLVAMSL